MTRRALVTGSAGFVGRNLVDHLTAAEWSVVEVDIRTGDNALDFFRRPPGKHFDLVVHAAAVVGGRMMIEGSPLELAAIDLELDAALWHWAAAARPGRVVYLSSSAAYPAAMQQRGARVHLREEWLDADGDTLRPDASYGFVKLVGERMAIEARAVGLAVTVVRPFSGYGPDQDVDYPFPAFIDRALRREDPFIVWGDGAQVRDFIHITDVVRAILKLAECEVDGPVNLGNGRPTSFNDLAAMVTAAAGYSPTIEHRPTRPVGVDYRVADVDRLRRVYEPEVDLAAGIEAALVYRARLMGGPT